MDTLLKHNKEVEENIDNNYFLKQWTSVKGANEELTRHLKHLINDQNTELLKKIAKGEIERLNELLKILDWHEPYRVCLEDQLTHWQQVLQDLER